MSRIQNILEKAEREGATLRTSRVAVPPATVAVPMGVEVPPHDEMAEFSGIIAPGAPVVTAGPSATALAGFDVPMFTVRLNPLLVAGLAPQSPAAEQYRALRTRLAHADGANNLRTVLVTSPQKGEGKSVTSANLALTMAQELQRRVVIVAVSRGRR